MHSGKRGSNCCAPTRSAFIGLVILNLLTLGLVVALLFVLLSVMGVTQSTGSNILNVLQVRQDGRLGVNQPSPQTTLEVRLAASSRQYLGP